jgi:hypothetical protein
VRYPLPAARHRLRRDQSHGWPDYRTPDQRHRQLPRLKCLCDHPIVQRKKNYFLIASCRVVLRHLNPIQVSIGMSEASESCTIPREQEEHRIKRVVQFLPEVVRPMAKRMALVRGSPRDKKPEHSSSALSIWEATVPLQIRKDSGYGRRYEYRYTPSQGAEKGFVPCHGRQSLVRA